MKVTIFLGLKPVTLNFKDFEDDVDVDQLTAVDPSNLYGEAVTVPALLNHVGMLKAQQEKVHADKKLGLEVYEAELKQSIRKTAVASGEKITENGISERVDSDPAAINKRKEVINANYNLSVMDSLFWAVSAKNKKLDNIIKAVTPEELWNELHEGVINNMMIKKHKSITEPKAK